MEPAEVAEELLDTAEKVVGDPVAAWAAVKAEVERRIAHREEWGTPGATKTTPEWVEPGGLGPCAGGAMPPRPDSRSQPRRSFAGFDRERATYERHKPELLKSAAGKFVVIVGDELVGPLETDEEAERVGYARFGLGPLYIKQVLAEEPPALVTENDVAATSRPHLSRAVVRRYGHGE